ncbi:MAG: LCP family protein [Leptolyngbyaceae cyanobacterium RU_5_1]|nr:LCP family protein [Leptolyngbyaceae cyanobacterium RU_5_1]
MKQIETRLDVPLEAGSNVQRSSISGKPQGSQKQAPVVQPSDPSSKRMKNSSPSHLCQKILALAIATTASATLGLMAAMLLPLPMGLVAKDKNLRPLDLWQVGIGYRVGRPVNVLVMGIDRVPDAKEGTDKVFSGRSDTMLLLRIDPGSDAVSLMSIPRDTQVDLPGIGISKINDANVQGGATLAARTVSSTLNGVSIDRYVRVSTDAFKELVDRLGGVEVYVPKPMVYEDKTQKLKINLAKGLQTLNGEQAEQFARFRQDDLGDIGRVQRQQTLLKVLRKRLTSPGIIPRIPALVQTMQKYIDTNLSVEEMLALVGAGRKLSEGKFKMVMLPGRFSAPSEFAASYWIMDSAGRDRVMKQYFGVDPVDFTSETSRPVASLRIAIQNASRNPDGAHQMRQHLAKLGFQDVYITSDWPNPQSQTQVIAQRGDFQAAEDLQTMLGAGNVEADSTGDLESDITIRVGDDWVEGKQ